jgi:hypothetical protein
MAAVSAAVWTIRSTVSAVCCVTASNATDGARVWTTARTAITGARRFAKRMTPAKDVWRRLCSMATYSVSSDTQREIVSFNPCTTPIAAFAQKAPAFDEWWATDVNLGGSTWMLSARYTKDAVEYVIWDSRNTGYINTSSIVLTSAQILGRVPMSYFVWWSLCVVWEYLKMWWVNVQLWFLLRKMYVTSRVRPYRSRIVKYYGTLRKRLPGRAGTVSASSSPPGPR